MNFLKRSINKRGFFLTLIYVIISLLYYVIYYFYKFYLKHSKINKDWIVFYSIPDYSDNAKYLSEYITNTSTNCKIIWLVKDMIKFDNNNGFKFVRINSKYHFGLPLNALFYISKSRIIFYTHVSPFSIINPKKNQTVVNLWHGCGYKNDIKGNRTFFEKNYFDCVLVPGNVFVDTKSAFFGCSKDRVAPIGYPRYDILLKDNSYTKLFVNKLKKNNKLVLWMPTFRNTGSNSFVEKNTSEYDIPLLCSNDDIVELNNFCKKNNILLCIKRHQLQLKYFAESLSLSNIVFIDNEYLLKNNIELYSFLRYSDALVTDYSSVAIDYLLLNKPIGFLLADYNEYKNARGFVFENPLEYMPGYHIYDNDNFKEMLIDISNGIDKYIDERKKIMKKVHNKTDNYCETVLNYVKKLVYRKEGNYSEKI